MRSRNREAWLAVRGVGEASTFVPKSTGGNTMTNMTFPITPGAGANDNADSVLPDLDPDGKANSEDTPDGAARGGATGDGDSTGANSEDLPYSWSDLDATEAGEA
jgi:hypothetical protein